MRDRSCLRIGCAWLGIGRAAELPNARGAVLREHPQSQGAKCACNGGLVSVQLDGHLDVVAWWTLCLPTLRQTECA